MKYALLILSTFVFTSLSAQSWQLSGSAMSTSQAERQSAKKVYLTVADNNGVLITGLKAANFTAFGENCNGLGRKCIFSPLEIVKPVEGVTSFEENVPGLYIITYQIKADPGISISHIFIQVFSQIVTPGPIKGQLKILRTQHAQILL